MESVAFIQWCLEHLNYWTITLLMTIESSFIPFPSEVIIPPAAYKAAVNDELNIYLVVLFATIGADIGALINYYLAKWLGRPIIYKFANSRIGHMCLIDEAKVQHAESYFDDGVDAGLAPRPLQEQQRGAHGGHARGVADGLAADLAVAGLVVADVVDVVGLVLAVLFLQ